MVREVLLLFLSADITARRETESEEEEGEGEKPMLSSSLLFSSTNVFLSMQRSAETCHLFARFNAILMLLSV